MPNQYLRIGMGLMLILLGYFAVDFIAEQQSTLNYINRLISLEIPKNSKLIQFSRSGDELTAIFEIDPKNRKNYASKYLRHESSFVDADYVITDAITESLESSYTYSTDSTYFVRSTCERAVLYMSSLSESGKTLSCWLAIPDWKTKPSCE